MSVEHNLYGEYIRGLIKRGSDVFVWLHKTNEGILNQGFEKRYVGYITSAGQA